MVSQGVNRGQHADARPGRIGGGEGYHRGAGRQKDESEDDDGQVRQEIESGFPFHFFHGPHQRESEIPYGIEREYESDQGQDCPYLLVRHEIGGREKYDPQAEEKQDRLDEKRGGKDPALVLGLSPELRYLPGHDRAYPDIRENGQERGQGYGIGENAPLGSAENPGGVDDDDRPEQTAADVRNAQPERVLGDGLPDGAVREKKVLDFKPHAI